MSTHNICFLWRNKKISSHNYHKILPLNNSSDCVVFRFNSPVNNISVMSRHPEREREREREREKESASGTA